MWVLFIILFLAVSDGKPLNKKQVCVIGAGRAGLAAIKTVASRLDDFEIIAFERNSDVGGLWIYTDSTDLDEHGLPVTARVYKNMRSLIPMEWMMYPEFNQFNYAGDELLVLHDVFLDYMKNFTNKFNLRRYIKFNTLVTKVIPIKGNGDWKTTTWLLELRDLNTNRNDTKICNAVMICNGHFFKPNIPKIPGLETFPGRVMHSSSYRRPENHANQTVLILGTGASGTGIAKDLRAYAKLVYLSRRSEMFLSIKPSNKVHVVRGVVKANGSSFILQDDSKIDADILIFCTGYQYDFPFLDEKSGIFVEKNEVQPLIHDVINIEHPSMAFIGLETYREFGAACVDQTKFFLAVLQEKIPIKLEKLEESLG